MAEQKPAVKNEPDWFDRPENVRKIIVGIYVVCALLFFADALYEKHTHFAFEGWFGFFGWYGFVACCAIVFGAKGLRRLIKRDERYYD